MTDEILDATKMLRQNYFVSQGERLERLAREGQSPKALFIGCSDSRVVPEYLLGANPGDLFVLRNVANIVPPYTQTEIGIASALEFAVQHLAIPHIIICGHTDCGGIKYLDGKPDLVQEPGLVRWLDLARPAQRDIDWKRLGLSQEERHLAIVERNVTVQLDNLRSYPFVRHALNTHKLELHGWVFNLAEKQITYFDPDMGQFRRG